MGCVVNGPGESKHADIGISLPGTFEEPKAPVYIDGQLYTTLRGEGVAEEFTRILDEYVARRYGLPHASGATARQLSHNFSEKNPHPSWHSTHRTTPPREPFRVFAIRLVLTSPRSTCRNFPSAFTNLMGGRVSLDPAGFTAFAPARP